MKSVTAMAEPVNWRFSRQLLSFACLLFGKVPLPLKNLYLTSPLRPAMIQETWTWDPHHTARRAAVRHDGIGTIVSAVENYVYLSVLYTPNLHHRSWQCRHTHCFCSKPLIAGESLLLQPGWWLDSFLTAVRWMMSTLSS